MLQMPLSVIMEYSIFGKKLSGYKITPKGMLQICFGQDIPWDVLRKIFEETLREC